MLKKGVFMSGIDVDGSTPSLMSLNKDINSTAAAYLIQCFEARIKRLEKRYTTGIVGAFYLMQLKITNVFNHLTVKPIMGSREFTQVLIMKALIRAADRAETAADKENEAEVHNIKAKAHSRIGEVRSSDDIRMLYIPQVETLLHPVFNTEESLYKRMYQARWLGNEAILIRAIDKHLDVRNQVAIATRRQGLFL
jgi:hypothetical protein